LETPLVNDLIGTVTSALPTILELEGRVTPSNIGDVVKSSGTIVASDKVGFGRLPKGRIIVTIFCSSLVVLDSKAVVGFSGVPG
jgi:hypothetical protein